MFAGGRRVERVGTVLSVASGTFDAMNDPAKILMLSGVVRTCPDCLDDRIFVSIDEYDTDSCEFCCTSCGAAVLIDPAFDYSLLIKRVA